MPFVRLKDSVRVVFQAKSRSAREDTASRVWRLVAAHDAAVGEILILDALKKKIAFKLTEDLFMRKKKILIIH